MVVGARCWSVERERAEVGSVTACYPQGVYPSVHRSALVVPLMV